MSNVYIHNFSPPEAGPSSHTEEKNLNTVKSWASESSTPTPILLRSTTHLHRVMHSDPPQRFHSMTLSVSGVVAEMLTTTSGVWRAPGGSSAPLCSGVASPSSTCRGRRFLMSEVPL